MQVFEEPPVALIEELAKKLLLLPLIPLTPPPPGIRNSSFISHNLPRHIPSKSLPFSTSLRSKTIQTDDEDLIQLSRELPRPAIEATLRSQLAELDALILPLRKDSERSSSLLLFTTTSQSSPHDSLNIDSVLAPSTNRGTAPIRLTIDLHRDLKEIHSLETVRRDAHISPKP